MNKAEQGTQERKRKGTIEIVAVILLGIASVATSWSGYQSTLWGGIQASSYSKAGAARIESSKAYTEGGELKSLDVAIFMEWLNAFAENKSKLARFYRERFREEFKAAFEAWFASDPKNNPDALPSPFVHPEYKLQSYERSQELSNKADALFKKGLAANQTSDNYVLNTVLFALVMFFSAISQTFLDKRIQVALLIIAASMFLYAGSSLFTLPVASN